MMFRGKITQGISQRELLLIGCQNLFPVGSMVDSGVKRLGSRQLVRNSFDNCFLKISHIVNVLYFIIPKMFSNFNLQK